MAYTVHKEHRQKPQLNSYHLEFSDYSIHLAGGALLEATKPPESRTDETGSQPQKFWAKIFPSCVFGSPQQFKGKSEKEV